MKSIARDRCGYEGYTCKGIAKLDEAFLTKVAAVDNYENLPVKIEGMTTAVDILQDMSIDWSPETACWQNTDVASGGFLDLLSKYGDKVVYKAMKELSQYTPYKEHLIDFRPDGTELKMLPGMLEPPTIEQAAAQVVTDPDPAVHTLPGMLVQYIQALKCVIEDIPLIPPDPDVCGIVGTISSIVSTDGVCEELGITHVSGKTVVSWSGEEEEPEMPEAKYTIAGGELNINGHVTEVEPVTLTAPFTVYLNAETTTTTAGDKTIKAAISTTKGVDSLLIGSVYLLRSDDAEKAEEDDPCPTDNTKYKMWRVSQAACSSDITYPSLHDDVDPAWEPEICGIEDIIGAIVSDISCATKIIKLYTGKVVQQCKLVDKSPYKDYRFTVSIGSICANCCNFKDGAGTTVEFACKPGSVLHGEHTVHRAYFEGTYRYTGRIDDDKYPIYYNGKYYLYHRPGKWVIGWWRGDAVYFACKLGDNPVGIWDKWSPAVGASDCPVVSCYGPEGMVLEPSFTPVPPVYECPVTTNAPYYTVAGFDVRINGQTVTVPAGVDGSANPIQAPFYAYLNVYKSGDKYSASMSLAKSSSAIAVFNVGGVSYRTPEDLESTDECETEAEQSTSYTKKGAYVISQDLCPGTDLFVTDTTTSSTAVTINTLLDAMNVSGCVDTVMVDHVTEYKGRYVSSTVPVVTWAETEVEPDFDDADCWWEIGWPGSFMKDGISLPIGGEAVRMLRQQRPPFNVWLISTAPKLKTGVGKAINYIDVFSDGKVPEETETATTRRWCTQIASVKVVKANSAVGGMLCKTVKISVVNCLDPVETSISGFQAEILLEGLVDCSIYTDFKIKKVSGPTVFYESQKPVSTVYSISGGYVTVNGYKRWVEGGLQMNAPFKAWVEPKATTKNNKVYVSFALKAANVESFPDGVLQIGGVRQIKISG